MSFGAARYSLGGTRGPNKAVNFKVPKNACQGCHISKLAGEIILKIMQFYSKNPKHFDTTNLFYGNNFLTYDVLSRHV